MASGVCLVCDWRYEGPLFVLLFASGLCNRLGPGTIVGSLGFGLLVRRVVPPFGSFSFSPRGGFSRSPLMSPPQNHPTALPSKLVNPGPRSTPIFFPLTPLVQVFPLTSTSQITPPNQHTSKDPKQPQKFGQSTPPSTLSTVLAPGKKSGWLQNFLRLQSTSALAFR